MRNQSYFCFKQKTAYEMRISDWSSDVCSSDLIRYRSVADENAQLAVPRYRFVEQRRDFALDRHVGSAEIASPIARLLVRVGSIRDQHRGTTSAPPLGDRRADPPRAARHDGPQIGKAQVRTRVCRFL